MDLFIIDAVSPFFLYQKEKNINWSKIPFHQLEKNGETDKKIYRKIKKKFVQYIKKVTAIGYNAVSLDDLCHLIPFPFYPGYLKRKIRFYQKRFSKLFEFAKKNKLKIFLNTDVMFFNHWLDKVIDGNESKMIKILKISLRYLFQFFPQVDGVIFRFGETDGTDVIGDFHSRLVLKTPRQANRFIHQLLPVFQQYDKQMIFRTWTTGAFRLGDLMWNKKTFHQTFSGCESDHFIISMKYGESDFFRFLDINPLFFEGPHRKLIELQTRREYEGFGEYPSFVGWDYRYYFNRLKNKANLVGIHVWCQTGGWGTCRNFTFLKKTSFWNELNTFITIRIFQDDMLVKDGIKEFCQGKKSNELVKFLKLSDQLVKQVLYDPKFNQQKYYLNRLRIPPNLHIFWNNVTVTHLFASFYQVFCPDKAGAIMAADQAFQKMRKMRKLALKLKLPYDYQFHRDTFRILTLARRYIYGDHSDQLVQKIEKLMSHYRQMYPDGYQFTFTENLDQPNFWFRILIRLAVRKKPGYRFIDRLIYHPFSARLILSFYYHFKKEFPDFMNKQAMPVESFFY
ncbi:MAG: glycosyl hydrolase family 67 [Spirochaetes bacterium]|nr:glycosyl hydrolase family 67 [Spirochaetota bacterium]